MYISSEESSDCPDLASESEQYYCTDSSSTDDTDTSDEDFSPLPEEECIEEEKESENKARAVISPHVPCFPI